VTLRVWDAFIFEGGKILFRVGLALFHLHERIILQAKSASEVSNSKLVRFNSSRVVQVYHVLQKDLGSDPEVVTKLMSVRLVLSTLSK